MSGPDASLHVPLPTANLRPRRRHGWAWLLPLVALAIAAHLGRGAWSARGPELLLTASEGHGIQPGDLLLHRGIAVGEVTRVALAPGLERVELRVRLEPAAEPLARAGSRFWVERPSIALDRLRGIETLLGGRHLSVLPGDPQGPTQAEFVCLEAPPILGLAEEGGLELLLEAPRTFGLAPGAPLTFRQIHVGTVTGVALSSDATRVEVRCVVRAGYARLVREDTRFWESGGLEAGFELLDGFSLELESLRSLLVGGISFATPTRPGPPARTGRRFELHAAPQEEWLSWAPALALGGELLPAGTPQPQPVRARLAWEQGFFSRSQSSAAWVLATQAGIVGPLEVLVAPEEVESATLELLGESVALGEPPAARGRRLALRRLGPTNVEGAWPSARIRALGAPEDCLVVGDPGQAPTAIAAARFTVGDGEWAVDPAIVFDEGWHGAAVLARRDGFLVGLLTVREGRSVVAPVQSLFD